MCVCEGVGICFTERTRIEDDAASFVHLLLYNTDTALHRTHAVHAIMASLLG